MNSVQLGHVHLKVRDLDRAVAFYSSIFGLRVTERVGDHYAFLSGGALHHEIALQRVGQHAPQPHPLGTGLYHVAFEAANRQALAAAYEALAAKGVEVAPVDHLISWAIYFNDPDGNGLEIYCDTRHDPGGATLWRGRNLPLTAAQLHTALAGEAVEAVV